MRTWNWTTLMLAAGLWIAGCTQGSGTIDFGGDDDDDVVADDDDDVVDDDDDVADDDDDVADDDDDVADDDDDVADDDDAIPAQPGVVFTIPSGHLAGTYEYLAEGYCDEYQYQGGSSIIIAGSEDGWWETGFEFVLEQFPAANELITWDQYMYWWVETWGEDDWAYAEGGPDCWVETGPEPWPHNTGYFECGEMWFGEGDHALFSFEIVDGAFRCP